MKMHIALILILTFILTGCGRPAEKPASAVSGGKVIATVNGEPIFDKDLKLSLALRFKDDPSMQVKPSTMSEQIQLIIDERLKLQSKTRENSVIKILK
ncbi:MAG: hypothetical protein PHR74_03390 [Candidatus Omnitrophica bacterium]|jgi:hypothetical protein|nr:hypothetical protein [Candidatus Omnitrophota bacterium]